MNIQELIEKINEIATETPFPNAKIVDHSEVIELIKQLDKPQKVQVPLIVADWIEACKEHLPIGLHTAMNPNFMKQNNQSSDLMLWIKKSSNQEIFAQAWIFGYTVEKEKRYYVSFKGMESGDFNYLNFIKFQHAWVLSSLKIDKKFRTEHTKKQLEEAGFGWVFDCEGIKIEEVEE